MIDITQYLKRFGSYNAIIVIVVAFIVAAVYLNVALIPQIIRVFSVSGEAGRLGSELRGAKSEIAEMDKLKSEILSYKAKIERYEKTLPVEQEIPSLLETLSNMAKESNVKIVGITPVVKKQDKSAKGQAYQEIPILINAKSGYHELGSFLSDLENCDRFMKVADIKMRSNKATPQKHDVELMVLTYILLKEK